MIIGTAGHIDHGKSSLVEALTGVHPDRLEEERRRGITLDLGFGHLDLGGGTAAGIVDVPGHERFVRTMLAGAGGVDVVLLAVAADAGVQAQTVEHFEICRLLGIAQGVVALTKCDLADAGRRQQVRREIAALAAGSFLERAAVVEVSARTGAGLDELRRALSAAVGRGSVRLPDAAMRLPLDRAFTMRGFGTVVTGTLLSGTLPAGAEVELQPAHRRLRVRGVQVHGRGVSAAQAGERTAVNLAGIEASELRRGMVLAEPEVFQPSAALDVALEPLSRTSVAHRARVHLHLQTAETVATVLWLEAPDLAQLQLAQPVLAAPGDRFILRQLSPARTLGGGRVLDPHPPLHRRHDYTTAAGWLRELAAADAGQAILLRLRRAGGEGMGLADLGATLGLRPAEVTAWLKRLPAVVNATHPPAAILAAEQETLERRVLAAITEFHRREPLLPGVSLPGLGLEAAPRWLALAAERLRAAGKLEAAPGTALLRLAGRATALSPEHAALRERLEAHFRAAGLSAPPLPQALTAFPQPAARQLLDALAREGVLVQCQPGWFVHAEALAAIRSWLTGRKAGHPAFSVAEFKQATRLTRKAAIPLLEYLDRQRLTRRVGDLREVI
ncbi:MAG: selenocysteine-specific translation elongation factor [Terriglobales bacterium]